MKKIIFILVFSIALISCTPLKKVITEPHSQYKIVKIDIASENRSYYFTRLLLQKSGGLDYSSAKNMLNLTFNTYSDKEFELELSDFYFFSPELRTEFTPESNIIPLKLVIMSKDLGITIPLNHISNNSNYGQMLSRKQLSTLHKIFRSEGPYTFELETEQGIFSVKDIQAVNFGNSLLLFESYINRKLTYKP